MKIRLPNKYPINKPMDAPSAILHFMDLIYSPEQTKYYIRRIKSSKENENQ